ncbi:MAG: hypothetical protein U0271_43910, partial [Polyangiaceae bacterium]
MTSLDVRPAWREGAAEVLVASHHPALAALVRASSVEIYESAETWELGERRVEAVHLGLVVDAPAWVTLKSDPVGHNHVREAFAAAVRSFETELGELVVLLRLPLAGMSRGAAYRTAPRSDPPEVDPDAAREGAIELALAYGEAKLAELLSRATLERSAVEGTSLVRWVVHLQPADLVEV